MHNGSWVSFCVGHGSLPETHCLLWITAITLPAAEPWRRRQVSIHICCQRPGMRQTMPCCTIRVVRLTILVASVIVVYLIL